MAKATGTVRDNGKPLAHASVTFHSQKDGVHAVELPPGPFKASDDITATPPKLLTPIKYGDPNSSGFAVEVVAGKSNIFDFDLKD